MRGWSSRSDADAEAYLVANNRLTGRGGWKERMLAGVRDVDPDLLLAAGYTDDDLADASAGTDSRDREEALPEPGDADEDVRPEV
ncbi:hypothetical protein ACIBQ1_40135 [Nonomuraea sp. NPDC050153]|uniref:hypothetical protein n=1 Tax=Nonomuraea sp. NPDC050153 TaxID=3364359 RepID=UPI003787C35E